MRSFVISFCVAVLLGFFAAPAVHGQGRQAHLALLQATTETRAAGSDPNCKEIRTQELILTCVYAPNLPKSIDSRAIPRIVLNGAEISFSPPTESVMRVQLTLTNRSGKTLSDQRRVYLAIDDANGKNHMRRVLPHVDFAKLEPGKRMTFEEKLLAPAFSPGTYVISIWIPSADPPLKFDPQYNLLFSSSGVADPTTGLNRIARFAVSSSTQSHRRSE